MCNNKYFYEVLQLIENRNSSIIQCKIFYKEISTKFIVHILLSKQTNFDYLSNIIGFAIKIVLIN